MMDFSKNSKSISIIASAFLLSSTLTSHAEEVVEPLIDGSTIELGNTLQQISVRAQSLGPGFCAVAFNIGEDTVQFLAPPLTWSEWVAAETAYASPTAVGVEENVICDTGVISEIKYVR